MKVSSTVAMWQDWLLVALSLLLTVSCVVAFMLCGWYVVWKLFLSKFKFLREIVGETQAQTQAKLRAPAEDSPTAHAKARHRVSFEHSASPPVHSTYSQGY
ncbi:small integral membrane protein 13 [Petromyzon marinus]|uniref:Small integral membrane protein 13 n=1 Tax=Petromyzon marinus TaxID=7757 RepID=A0AAJ7SYD2_PETMA|nr:small integral membrane protein 13 [Petromyzon marinus]XP_032807853.1 small integral membrane protein 13 [Petromyzon marinus]